MSFISKDLPCFVLNFTRGFDYWSLLQVKLSSQKTSALKKLVIHCSGEALRLNTFSLALEVVHYLFLSYYVSMYRNFRNPQCLPAFKQYY